MSGQCQRMTMIMYKSLLPCLLFAIRFTCWTVSCAGYFHWRWFRWQRSHLPPCFVSVSPLPCVLTQKMMPRPWMRDVFLTRPAHDFGEKRPRWSRQMTCPLLLSHWLLLGGVAIVRYIVQEARQESVVVHSCTRVHQAHFQGKNITLQWVDKCRVNSVCVLERAHLLGYTCYGCTISSLLDM